MLEKTIAEKLHKIAEDELLEKGFSSFETIYNMKKVVEKANIDYLTYFYSENGKMIFNLKRWKRHFLEDRID